MKFIKVIQQTFSTDLRALALMRMAVALVLVYDITIRYSVIDAFYTDYGATPTDSIRRFISYFWTYSVYYFSSDPLYTKSLFILHGICAVGLLLGWQTRFFTVVCWVLLLSAHSRNPLILQGGDDLLRLTLFWGIFLPWGKRYSIDAKQNSYTGSNTVTGFACVAYTLQICSVYTFSALLKGPEWYREFTALYYAFHIDQIVLKPAVWLRQFPDLLSALTAIAFYFELLVPICVLWPSADTRPRTIGVFAILFFHLWNGFTLYVGLFFIIGICTAIGLFPERVMDFIAARSVRIRTVVSALFSKLAHTLPRFSLSFTIPFSSCILSVVLISLTLYVLAWNIGNLTFSKYRLSDKMYVIGNTLRIDQHWGMFAPGVLKDDGWFIYEALLETGDTIDLNRKALPVTYEKPERIVSLFKNDRWRKFTENYTLIRHGFIRGYLCDYLTTQWNTENPQKKIRQLRILFMKETTLPDYVYSAPVMEELYVCGERFNQPLPVRNQKLGSHSEVSHHRHLLHRKLNLKE